jgi:D-alanyl-D-alanine carboxypeptidase
VAITAFNNNHRRQPRPVGQALNLREQSGGFTLLRVEKSEPLAITVLLKEKYTDQLGRLEIVVDGENPPKTVRESLMPVSYPPDLAIPRLTERAALEDLADFTQQAAEGDRFSGVVLIARHGRILLEKAWGLADRERKIPATAATKFNLASVNKMLTATAVLQLIESGKLGFDDTIAKYLPDYVNKELAQKVTIRHLLTHTGGTGDIFGAEYSRDRLTLREHEDYVRLFQSRGLLFEPGSEYRYSNYGFILLGRIIEKVTSVSFDEYMQRKIFALAGMKSTGSWPESEAVPGRAAGYRRRDGAWVSNADSLPWRGMAHACDYSTARDLYQFAQALQAGKLISKTMLADATVPRRDQTGYGFAVRGEGVLRHFGHPGGTPGVSADVRIFPDLGYVLIGLSNLDPPSAERVLDRFMDRMAIR